MTHDNDLDKHQWGAKALAVELNCTTRKAFHLLAKGEIPATKIGNRYLWTRRKVRQAIGTLAAE
mgnify:CR=1 FL=1